MTRMRYAPADALAPLSPGGAAAAPVVVAQLGQTLDGRIATVTGDSKYISGREALKHLHRLRASVDAVVVGVGTVEADDPQLTVRLVQGRSPVRVVLDPAGRTPPRSRLLGCDRAETLLICGPDAAPPPGARVLRLPLGPGRCFPPEDVVQALARLGLRRILVEGGAETLGRFLDAGRIDVLHLLVAPMILGSGKAGLTLRPIADLSDALRPQTCVHVFDDGDVLFACDLRPKLEAAE